MKVYSLIFLLIVTAAVPLSAQDSGLNTSILRIGNTIDNAEVGYFGLFPDISRSCAATVQQNDSGWTIFVHSGSVEHVISISDCEYDALAGFLDVFEHMGASEDHLLVLEKELRDASRVRCFLRLMQKRVLSFSALQKPSGKSCEFVLRDGTHVSGIPLEATRSSVSLWTLPSTPFNIHDGATAMVRYRWSDVDSVSGQWHTNSPQHGWLGWLIATASISYFFTETQRNPWDGRGGSGLTAYSYPVALLISGSIAVLPMLVVMSKFGEAHRYVEVKQDNLDDIIGTLQETRMYTIPPPEARSGMDSISDQELLRDQDVSDTAADQSVPKADPVRPVPDLDAGITFLFNIYDVQGRPFGTLPALWIGKEIPVWNDATPQPVLSLFPRAAIGTLHAAAGMNLILNTGRVKIHLGLIHVWNWDELGRYTHSRLGWLEEWESRFVDGDVSRVSFATFSFDFLLARMRVLVETHIPLKETIIVTYRNQEASDGDVKMYEHAPQYYPAISLSLSYPIFW